jgi:hypothetical protein
LRNETLGLIEADAGHSACGQTTSRIVSRQRLVLQPPLHDAAEECEERRCGDVDRCDLLAIGRGKRERDRDRQQQREDRRRPRTDN